MRKKSQTVKSTSESTKPTRTHTDPKKEGRLRISIGYFYYDLLNLYGDSGNVRALAYHLREQGVDVTVHRLTLEDPKEIASYDWIYMGCGIERSLILALTDIRKYKEAFQKALDDGTYILATGNSFELFGKEIRMPNRTYPCLGLLDFSTEYKARTVHDLLLPYGEHQLMGFENHSGVTVENHEKPFLTSDDRMEGVTKNHFTGTYTVGPLLVRNPFLCRELVKNLILTKDPSFRLLEGDYTQEEEAYANSLKWMQETRLS